MNDTIAALSTPSGESAIAAIRLSGSECRKIASLALGAKTDTPARRMNYAFYRDLSGNKIDDVTYCIFDSPASYTGEDMLEIFTHGNPFIVRKILDDIIARGIRGAQAGEFTRRAFLNNKMDLSQAEAVARLISARSEASLNAARKQMSGGLSERIGEISSALLDMRALIEAYIDFPDEDLPPSDTERLTAIAKNALAEMKRLTETSKYDALIHDGINIVIAGAPNAGKSSLLNALTGKNRAIVSSTAGTTRDFIDDRLVIGDYTVNITDTAGIRSTENEIEAEGVRRACEKISNCDICLLVLDSTDDIPALPNEVADTLSETNCIVVANKTDLPTSDTKIMEQKFGNLNFIEISCTQSKGILELRDSILSLIKKYHIRASTDDVLAGARHADALARASISLSDALEKINLQEPPELASSDLCDALDALGEILGKTDNEAVLDRIFSKFCIGK